MGPPNMTFVRSVQRLNGLGRYVGFFLGFFALSAAAGVKAGESKSFPLPFSGTFQSLASEARELRSWDKNSWSTIPQNVFLTLVKDEEIIELQLKIGVLDDLGQVRYPINNRMWLRRVAGNQLEIYKLNKTMDKFDQVGEGVCTAASCSYQYVTLAQNNGNPYKQRYMSTITWDPENTEGGFSQSGSLSAEATEKDGGQKTWLVFKTWANQFEAVPEP
jgi:hypothetical protein